MTKVVVKKGAARMTELFRRAFERAAEELPEYEQDEFANWLLKALESDEKQWDAAFAQSGQVLDRLEAQALEDIKAGHAEPLDPDKL
jgi:LPS sulfotransferase NodH